MVDVVPSAMFSYSGVEVIKSSIIYIIRYGHFWLWKRSYLMFRTTFIYDTFHLSYTHMTAVKYERDIE